MALLSLYALNLNAILNVLTVVLALILAGLVLRLLLRVTRVLFTVGCLGLVVAAVIWAVVTFIPHG